MDLSGYLLKIFILWALPSLAPKSCPKVLRIPLRGECYIPSGSSSEEAVSNQKVILVAKNIIIRHNRPRVDIKFRLH